MKQPKYKRILLKVSGEALLGDEPFGVCPKVVATVAQNIKRAHQMGVQIAVVVGGGNIFRGMQSSEKLGVSRATADYIGMLATVMNAMILRSAIKKAGISCRVQTAIDINALAEPYLRFKAMRHLEKDIVVIFAAGTGNPFFTTDTAAALRASEVDAEVMLMAKNKVDGVYDKDPHSHADAKKFETLDYDELIKRDLRIIDTSAAALCKENKIPIIVYDFEDDTALERILSGKKVGTYIGNNNSEIKI